MDCTSLAALKARVRPIGLSGALTLEQASTAERHNCEVARFHAAVAQAHRILELAGVLDDRLEHELVARATQLARAREILARGLEPERRV